MPLLSTVREETVVGHDGVKHELINGGAGCTAAVFCTCYRRQRLCYQRYNMKG